MVPLRGLVLLLAVGALAASGCWAASRPVQGDGGESETSAGGSADATSGGPRPAEPVLDMSISAIKRFEFRWGLVDGAEHYELLESAAAGEPFVPVAEDLHGGAYTLVVPLHLRHQASYRLRACNAHGCTDAADVSVEGSLVEAVGYVKASNASNAADGDEFGSAIALSRDGSTLVVGAPREDSDATGVDGDQTSDAVNHSGAAYVFVRDAEGQWSQQAYLKASDPGVFDAFGNDHAIALSDDGSVLAIGAHSEDGGVGGIDGDPSDDSLRSAGAVYVFERDAEGQWSQQAYVKSFVPASRDYFGSSVALSGDGTLLAVGASGYGAVIVFERDAGGTWLQRAYVRASNAHPQDKFGHSIALSRDGDVLAVGAWLEQSAATGIDGDEADDSLTKAGAAYVFVRDAEGRWSQQAYVKASNTASYEHFGISVALSGDGATLAVGGDDDSLATGIDGDPHDSSSSYVGAVHVFVRDASGQWSQQAYIKASNADGQDEFGHSVALDADGSMLVVGAINEDSSAAGIGGDQADQSLGYSGAAYVFVRDAAGQWSQRAYVKASNPGRGDHFGRSVALSDDGQTLAVGAESEDEGAGAVYLF
jgi:hypothetical protein